MTQEERIARGYVMVACVAYFKRNGVIYHASKYGKKCFPIWKKTGGNAKGHANDVTIA